MTKEELKALGLNDEQVEKVYDDQSKNFVKKDQFNEKNEALKKLTDEKKAVDESLKALQDEMEGLKKVGVNSEGDVKKLQLQIDTITKKLEVAEKARQEAEDKRISSEILAQTVDALTKGNAREPKEFAQLVISKVTVADDGSYVYTKDDGTTVPLAEGAEHWLEQHKWAVQSQQKPGSGAKGGQPGGTPLSKEEFNKFDYAARVKLKTEDPETYAAMTER